LPLCSWLAHKRARGSEAALMTMMWLWSTGIEHGDTER